VFQKNKPWRSRKYLDWVKTQPCVVTGLPADDPNHMKGHGMGGTMKPPDWATYPMTRAEHTHFHNIGWRTWEEKHGSQWEYVAKTLGRALEQGIITIK
jgi:hypothetical protein